MKKAIFSYNFPHFPKTNSDNEAFSATASERISQSSL